MRVAIGIVPYAESTAKYLPYFLASLKMQTERDFVLLVYDNTDNGSTANRELLENSELQTEIFGDGTNLGFGKAYNVLINKAVELRTDLFLAVNLDMYFAPDMLAKLIADLDTDPSAGAVAPKILRWDFAQKQPTGTIDSLGLISDRYFRFFDDQQGKQDRSELGKKEILGFTGAAVLLRLDALRTIKFEREYFDESMFMYKEDCDISLRLRLAGWKILLEPSAIAYHDRTAASIGQNVAQIRSGRKFKSRIVKQWSFLNQLILLAKFSRILPIKVRIRAWTYELLSIGYAAVFETYLLRQLMVFRRLHQLVKIKSEAMPVKIDPRELDKYFS